MGDDSSDDRSSNENEALRPLTANNNRIQYKAVNRNCRALNFAFQSCGTRVTVNGRRYGDVKPDATGAAITVLSDDDSHHAVSDVDMEQVKDEPMPDVFEGPMEVDDEKLDDQASQFTPPCKLDEMQPHITCLKNYEQKLNEGLKPSTAKKKLAEKAIEKIREILEAESMKALEDATYINAAFVKYHGNHLAAYAIGHDKGSGCDEHHTDTVNLAVQLKEKVEEEHREVQQTTTDPLALLNQAIALKNYYNAFVHDLAEKTGGNLKLPAPKGLYRIVEKCAMRPGEGRNMCHHVFDVLRSMVVFKNDESIGQAIQYVSNQAQVVRVKERLSASSRTSEGWGDVMINFRLKLPAEVSSADTHVCEIQFARVEMEAMRSTLHGHKEYVLFRAAEELHAVNSMPLPTTKLSTTISQRISACQDAEEWGKCNKLQQIFQRAKNIEQSLDKIKHNISRSKEDLQFKKLQERKNMLYQQLESLRNKSSSL